MTPEKGGLRAEDNTEYW